VYNERRFQFAEEPHFSGHSIAFAAEVPGMFLSMHPQYLRRHCSVLLFLPPAGNKIKS
jgi:hypothetical protein